MRLIFAMIAGLGTPVAADPVVVFAAASLKEPLDVLAAQMDVVVSYGGSGALARQIMLGAPADVVLLANDAWMQDLIAAGLVTDVADFASNSLVLIGPAKASDVALADLPSVLGDQKIAMGFTRAVPAGIYGRMAFEHLALWPAVSANVVEVDNVRSALVLVARAEAAFGVTYATDTRVTDAVRILAQFAPETHPPVRYTGGQVSNDPAVKAFWDLVQSDAGQAVFAQVGFLPAVTP